MSIFPLCECIDDAIELAPNLGFYLKPIAKISITIQLPSNKLVDKKLLSNYDLINHLRTLIKPKTFITIKITKITLQFIRIDGELQNKSDVLFVLTCLNEKNIKLPNSLDELKIRAAEAKLNFPNRHIWNSSFRDAEHKILSGEMTDTLHLKHLPRIWFTRHDDRIKEAINPSKYLLREVFKSFGEIERVEIPHIETCSQDNSSSSDERLISLKRNSFFDAYIKYKDYIGFIKAMDTLKGMKLVHKERHKYYSSNIQVDFDKTKHSEATIKKELSKFQISSDTNEKKELFKISLQERIPQSESSQLMEEKAKKIERRRKREEKRKLREIEKLKAQESEQINIKIKIEEKKLLRAQRNLQSLRLLDELLERIKNIKLEQLKGDIHQTINKSSNNITNNQELPNKSNLEDVEKELRSRLINKYRKKKNEIQKQKNTFEEKLVENNVPKKTPKISSSNKHGREYQQLSRNKYHSEKYYNRPYSNSYFKNKKQQFQNNRNYQKANNRNSHHHHHIFHHPHENLNHSDFMDIHNTYLRYFRKISYASPTTTSSSERNNSPKSRESSSKTISSTSS